MPKELAFWVLMLVWLVFNGAWFRSQPAGGGGYWGAGNSLIVFILLVLLGLHAFGPPLKG